MSAGKMRVVFVALAVMLNGFAASAESIERPLKVAFFGDQGHGDASWDVLRLVRDEKADMVIHLGDFDYDDDPVAFEAQINEVLGKDFPIFAVMGNHDKDVWQHYKKNFEQRLQRLPGVRCEGEFGIKAACTYRGLFFILSAVGAQSWAGITGRDETIEKDHADFIEDSLNASAAIWRVCAWHKNQHAMQVGKKRDETGWGVYEACRKGGAIIATAHEHSYSRTHLMEKFSDAPLIASKDETLRLEPGRTFAFVSGLGGKSVRSMRGPADPWWAAYYTRDQKARAGALFCTFNPQRREREAHCQFKAVDGTVVDRFKVISGL